MSRRFPTIRAFAWLLALSSGIACLAPAMRAEDRTGLTWTHYYDQDQVVVALQTMHAEHPGLTELRSLGKSAEGRDIWCLTITNEKTGPDVGKPAMYVDGAIHGNEIQATEVCLYTAWQLLTKYGEWDKITELLNRAVFYIVPTVNVDNRARFFSDPGSYNIGRSARQPHDDDHDGLQDEDEIGTSQAPSQGDGQGSAAGGPAPREDEGAVGVAHVPLGALAIVGRG